MSSSDDWDREFDRQLEVLDLPDEPVEEIRPSQFFLGHWNSQKGGGYDLIGIYQSKPYFWNSSSGKWELMKED